MILTGVGRIGRDVNIKQTKDGTAFANVALAFNYGRKDDSGKRPVQWVDATIWGRQAEVLAQYLLKGSQVSVVICDLHIATWEGKNGTGVKLVGRLDQVELVGVAKSKNEETSNMRDSYDDDIPF